MDTTSSSLIARKRHELIELAEDASTRSDSRAKADLDMRITYLTRLKDDLDAPTRKYPKQQIFVAYSENSGKKYYEKAKSIIEDKGFGVVTGFSRTESENVLHAVLGAINEASLFLGILTPEYKIRSLWWKGRKNQTAPSVWVIEEKGMALALGKTTRLLIEETVHEDFWRGTTPEKLQTTFRDDEFEEKAETAVNALVRKYEQMLLTASNV